jgi:hypothetical protein
MSNLAYELERNYEIEVPVTALFTHVTPELLARYVVDRMGLSMHVMGELEVMAIPPELSMRGFVII